MHVNVNMCMQYKTTLYISEINVIPLKCPFMLIHAERKREREREREREERERERGEKERGYYKKIVRTSSFFKICLIIPSHPHFFIVL